MHRCLLATCLALALASNWGPADGLAEMAKPSTVPQHQQVPQLMTIVVSASDNSYVSSSPIFDSSSSSASPDQEVTTATTATTTTAAAFQSKHKEASRLTHKPRRPSDKFEHAGSELDGRGRKRHVPVGRNRHRHRHHLHYRDQHKRLSLGRMFVEFEDENEIDLDDLGSPAKSRSSKPVELEHSGYPHSSNDGDNNDDDDINNNSNSYNDDDTDDDDGEFREARNMVFDSIGWDDNDNVEDGGTGGDEPEGGATFEDRVDYLAADDGEVQLTRSSSHLATTSQPSVPSNSTSIHHFDDDDGDLEEGSPNSATTKDPTSEVLSVSPGSAGQRVGQLEARKLVDGHSHKFVRGFYPSFAIPSNSAAFHDASIETLYDVNRATIIKTRDSIEMGATFINYTIVTNLNACLVECWITDSCDTAIYQESAVDFNKHLPNFITTSTSTSFANDNNRNRVNLEKISQNLISNNDAQEPGTSAEQDTSKPSSVNLNQHPHHLELVSKASSLGVATASRNRVDEVKLLQEGFYICYLFECSKADGFKCKFSPHNYYISSTKKTLARQVRRSSESANRETFSQPEPELVLGNDIPLSEVKIVPSAEEQQPHYSRIVTSHRYINNHPSSDRRFDSWHDSHIASINIGPEAPHVRGGLNSAIIAIIFGIGATGMLIAVVGHKMKSIRRRIAHKGHHRRCIVHDADFLATS